MLWLTIWEGQVIVIYIWVLLHYITYENAIKKKFIFWHARHEILWIKKKKLYMKSYELNCKGNGFYFKNTQHHHSKEQKKLLKI